MTKIRLRSKNPRLAVLGFVIFVALITLAGLYLRQNRQTQSQPIGLHATVDGATIILEEAITDAQQQLGLGGRANLATDHGMLFRFSLAQRPSFWMKGMQFPLDFLWIRNAKIVDLTEHVAAPIAALPNTELLVYTPKQEVDSVIEVNAGFVGYNKIKIGDEVQGL